MRTDGGEAIAFDGMYSEGFRAALMEIIIKRKKIRGSSGTLYGNRGDCFREKEYGEELAMRSTLMKAEQSNTSTVYDNKCILKLFRRLENGINPDAEISRYLSDKAHFANTPCFGGTIEFKKPAGEPICVALMQKFVPAQADAWEFALAHVREYFERVLSQKPDISAMPKVSVLLSSAGQDEASKALKALCGEFFTEMIAVLGQRTGELHKAFASAVSDPAFAPEPFSILYQRSVYQSMKSLQRNVFSMITKTASGFNGDVAEELKAVLGFDREINACYEKMLGRKFSGMKIRIHGDYHLGQVLFTGKDMVIIDFEGEPVRSLSERRLKRSALRDIAGMVRSFHYAAYAALLKHPSVRAEDRSALEPWVKIWYTYISNLFVSSYLSTVGTADFLPSDHNEFSVLFKAFLLEKAVYELWYEFNNRPDWLLIPAKGIEYTLIDAGGTS